MALNLIKRSELTEGLTNEQGDSNSTDIEDHINGILAGAAGYEAGNALKLGGVDAGQYAVASSTIVGDGTAGRVLRCSRIDVLNGTTAATIKVIVNNVWNGDALSAQDNFAVGNNSTYVALNAGGNTVTIKDTAISGNTIAILSANLYENDCGTGLNVGASVSSGIVLAFTNSASGTAVNLTSLVDTGSIYVLV